MIERRFSDEPETFSSELPLCKELTITSFSPLSPVESCSMDTLRNSVKSMVDLGYVGYKKGTQLHLVDSNRVMEVVEQITDFKW
jgi:hypothetical protein